MNSCKILKSILRFVMFINVNKENRSVYHLDTLYFFMAY